MESHSAQPKRPLRIGTATSISKSRRSHKNEKLKHIIKKSNAISDNLRVFIFVISLQIEAAEATHG